MKIMYNARLLLLTAIIATVSFIACKKDTADTNSGVTELLSFGPTGAMPGDTIRFFGNNLDKVSEIDFTGANVTSDVFVSKTQTEIFVIVPKATEKGYVTLKTSSGNITSKTEFNVSVATTISSITSVARPGENITIKGNYLNWVKSVTFNDGKVANTFVNQSINELVVTVPADAQTGTLVLAYGGTDSSIVETTDTLHVTLPLVTALAPNPVKHQTELTITGTDLDLAKQILFTGVTNPVTEFVSQSATQIVVKVPGSTQKGKIKLVAASGIKVETSQELDVVLPSVSAMSPNPIDPETNITVTGTNLNLVTSITFENAPAVTTFISQTATQIVAKVPAGVLRGKITLAVLNSTLTVQSPDILEITGSVPPPTIAFPIYNDAVTSNWNGWTGGGWGGTSDISNTSPVREGTKSWKINYDGGWGAPLQLGGASVTIAPYTTFKISIYGGPGTAGKKVNIGINGSDGYTITLVEGTWTDYAIPVSSLTTATKITDIIVKEYNGTGGFTIYVDALGLN